MGSSVRALKRNMARNLLKDLGADHVNKRMHMSNGNMNRKQFRKLLKTKHGRRRWNAYSQEFFPLWKRVLIGDMSKRAQRAFMVASGKRLSPKE